MRPDNVRFLLPSGRSLGESTLRHLEAGGITVARSHPRCYAADMWEQRIPNGFPNLPRKVHFAKPEKIAELVASGEYDAGITGFDMLHEVLGPKGVENEKFWEFEDVEICANHHYGRARDAAQRIVLFAVQGNARQRPTADDLIASEYPNITRRMFDAFNGQGTIVPSVGCVEARVLSGKCAFGVTLVESGETLNSNNFVEVWTLMTTWPVLIVNKKALASDKGGALELMSKKIDTALTKSLNLKEGN